MDNYTDEILTEIEVNPIAASNDVLTEIEVKPHNSMKAVYEVQQPPVLTAEFKAIQDSFTRSETDYQTINYGSGNSMVVGRQANNTWQSFIDFDISSFTNNSLLIDAKLRLHYSGTMLDDTKILLEQAETNWSQYSITYLNKPQTKKFLTDQFTINKEQKYIEFDLTDIVKTWLKDGEKHHSVSLSLADDSVDTQAIFRTSESTSSPAILLHYYDPRIFSMGRTQIPTEIIAYSRKNSDKNTVIEVDSTFSFSYIPTEIRIHQVDVPFDEDILTEIAVSKPVTYAEITAAIRLTDDIPLELSARSNVIHDATFASVAATRKVVDSELFVRYQNTVLTEIQPRVEGTSVIPTVIDVNRPEVLTELYSRALGFNGIATEIRPRAIGNSIVPTEINVIRKEVFTNIYSRALGFSAISVEIISKVLTDNDIPTVIDSSRDAIAMEIAAAVHRDSDILTEITATRPAILTELTLGHVFGRKDILTEIDAKSTSNVPVEITVTRPDVPTEITARLHRENILDTEIFVAYQSIIDTEINIKTVSQVDTEITIVPSSRRKAEITVSRPSVLTEIRVLYPGVSDVGVEIEPRILMVNNINMVITVGHKPKGYAFIL